MTIASDRDREIVEGFRESGVHGGIEKIPDPEDIDIAEQQGNTPYPKNEWNRYYTSKSRNRGVMPAAEDETSGFKDERYFGDSEKESRRKREGPNPNWARQIHLDRVGYESSLYQKLVDLSTVWMSKNTEIVYKVGGNPEQDRIVFKNPELRGKFERDSHETSLSLAELKEALETSKIRLDITRPKGPQDKRFIQDLKHLKLGSGVLGSKKVRVEFSKTAQEKQNQEDNVFNLRLNQKLLDKYTTEEEKGRIEFFLGQLKHTDIGWLGFEVSKGDDPREITGVTLVSKKGERMTIPAHLFRKVFENVLSYKHKDGSMGFEFVIPNGKHGSIYPGMPHEELVGTARKLRIADKELPGDTIYYI